MDFLFQMSVSLVHDDPILLERLARKAANSETNKRSFEHNQKMQAYCAAKGAGK